MLNFIKNTERQINTLQLHTRDLDDCLKVVVKRFERVSYSEIVAAKHDIVIVNDCRELHSKRDKKKKKQLERQIKRAANKTQKVVDQQTKKLATARVEAAVKLVELKTIHDSTNIVMKKKAMLKMKLSIDEENYRSSYALSTSRRSLMSMKTAKERYNELFSQ